MSENREFFIKESFLTLQLVSGIVVLVLGGVMLVLFGSMGFFILIGILMIVIYAWGKGRPIVKLEDDHMEIKTGIAAPKKMILYSEIKSIERVSVKKVFLQVQGEGGNKKVRLPVNVLTDEAQKILLRELRQKTQA